MGKVTTYVLMFTGLSLLFYYFGLIGNNALLTMILNPQNLSTSQFWTSIVIASLSTMSAIFVGIYYRNVELASATVVVPFFFSLLWDFIQVFNRIRVENEFIAIVFFAPILFLFLMTMYEYWRGMTT